MLNERNGGTRSSGGIGGAALAACEALTSLACLTEAKLAIVKQHPQVREPDPSTVLRVQQQSTPARLRGETTVWPPSDVGPAETCD